MNIVFIRTNAVNPDPRVEKEVETLANNGHSVTILAWNRYNNSNEESEIIFKNCTVKIIRFGVIGEWGGGIGRNLFPYLRFVKSFKNWIKMNYASIDVIHCCDYFTIQPIISFAHRKRIRVIFDIFDFYSDTKSFNPLMYKIVSYLERRMINKSDATIICNESRIAQIHPSKPKILSIIHNSPKEFMNNYSDKRLGINTQPIRIAYIGNLIPERFIVEVANIVASDPQYELHIGGEGPLMEYFSKLSQEKSNIIYYGKIPYDKVLEIESKSDLMIAFYNLNIRNHKFISPNKFYESLLLKKPLLVFKDSGIDEIVTTNNIGIAVEPTITGVKNALELASKKIMEVSFDYNKMAVLYNESFSWSIMEQRLLNLYNTLSDKIL